MHLYNAFWLCSVPFYLYPTLSTSPPPLYKPLSHSLSFYFVTHWVWPGPSLLWTWVWDYPLETRALSGYAVEDTDPRPMESVQQGGLGPTLSIHTWLLTAPALPRPRRLLWAHDFNGCHTLKVALARSSLCLLALRVLCASAVIWLVMEPLPHCLPFDVCLYYSWATSPSSMKSVGYTGKFLFGGSWCWIRWNWKGWHLYHLILPSRNTIYLFYLFTQFPVHIWMIYTLIYVGPAPFCWVYPSCGVELLSWLTPVFVYHNSP